MLTGDRVTPGFQGNSNLGQFQGVKPVSTVNEQREKFGSSLPENVPMFLRYSAGYAFGRKRISKGKTLFRSTGWKTTNQCLMRFYSTNGSAENRRDSRLPRRIQPTAANRQPEQYVESAGAIGSILPNAPTAIQDLVKGWLGSGNRNFTRSVDDATANCCQ